MTDIVLIRRAAIPAPSLFSRQALRLAGEQDQDSRKAQAEKSQGYVIHGNVGPYPVVDRAVDEGPDAVAQIDEGVELSDEELLVPLASQCLGKGRRSDHREGADEEHTDAGKDRIPGRLEGEGSHQAYHGGDDHEAVADPDAPLVDDGAVHDLSEGHGQHCRGIDGGREVLGEADILKMGGKGAHEGPRRDGDHCAEEGDGDPLSPKEGLGGTGLSRSRAIASLGRLRTRAGLFDQDEIGDQRDRRHDASQHSDRSPPAEGKDEAAGEPVEERGPETAPHHDYPDDRIALFGEAVAYEKRQGHGRAEYVAESDEEIYHVELGDGAGEALDQVDARGQDPRDPHALDYPVAAEDLSADQGARDASQGKKALAPREYAPREAQGFADGYDEERKAVGADGQLGEHHHYAAGHQR